MEDKVCPFCHEGEETWRFEHSNGLDLNFSCETALRSGNVWIKGIPCLERQLAQLQAQVEGMRDVVQAVAELPSDGFYADSLFTSKIIPQSQALLTPTSGEFVVVRREDLAAARKYVDHCFDYSDDPDDPRSWMQNFLSKYDEGYLLYDPKAALGRGGEE